MKKELNFENLTIAYNNSQGRCLTKRKHFQEIIDACIEEYGYITAELDNAITDCILENTTKKISCGNYDNYFGLNDME